jgi:hypothetical protein
MLWLMIALVVFLLLWGLAWHSQPRLAFGIFIGLLIGAVIAPNLGPYESIADVPIWLPPLPFATVTVVLMTYGFLAWWILDVKAKRD